MHDTHRAAVAGFYETHPINEDEILQKLSGHAASGLRALAVPSALRASAAAEVHRWASTRTRREEVNEHTRDGC